MPLIICHVAGYSFISLSDYNDVSPCFAVVGVHHFSSLAALPHLSAGYNCKSLTHSLTHSLPLYKQLHLPANAIMA